jgi:phytoene dehydrogenase-like protein
VQYAPHRLRARDWTAERDALGDRVIAQLEEALPGLTDRIEGRQVLTPADLEAEFALPGGHWHHIETGLDQTFVLRPVPRFAQYRTPVAGLYLCGAGSHPGGGLTGAPGANAARQALADLKTGAYRQAREAAE